MKKLIGLTGRTGSGKSSAARIFESMGAFVADCDKVAHEVLLDKKTKEKLCLLFSDSILDAEKNINRKTLGSIVFSDKEKLKLLNSVMHPAIVKRCIDLCKSSGKDICIMDGSELEASGADEKCDHIIVTVADEKTRLGRIITRDNIDRDAALRRIYSQNDYSKKAIIVENNGTEEEFRKKIRLLYNKFLGELND